MSDETWEYPIENRIASAKGRMNRAWSRRQELLGTLAKVNAEYSNALQEYHALDRMRAEQNITYCPPAEPKKRRKKKEDKTSEDVGALVSAVSNMSEKEKQELLAQLENKMKGGE